MGLEVVVRPVVLPNIRPLVARRIAPPDDPTKGICSLGGGGGGTFIGVSESFSINVSKQKPLVEEKRQVDVERVYQQDDAGNINKSNFVDVERMKKVKTTEQVFVPAIDPLHPQGNVVLRDGNYVYADPPESRPNVEVIETNKTIESRD
jgi:hypothetical protein